MESAIMFYFKSTYFIIFYFFINSVLNIDSFMGGCIHLQFGICMYVNHTSLSFWEKNQVTATLKKVRATEI